MDIKQIKTNSFKAGLIRELDARFNKISNFAKSTFKDYDNLDGIISEIEITLEEVKELAAELKSL